MAQIHWFADANGNFRTKADWTGGVVPGPADAAILDPPSGRQYYIVSTTTSQTVNFIRTAPQSFLYITAGVFYATNASRAGHNVGAIAVFSGATFRLGGSLDNDGFLALGGDGSVGHVASLIIGGAVSLDGGGQVTCGDGFVRIYGIPGATLTNVNNKMDAAGYLGMGQLTLINQTHGTITGSGLVIDTGSNTIMNAGEIVAEARSGVLVKSAIDNTGLLYADAFKLIVDGAVTGTGRAEINGSLLAFGSSFNEDVTFIGKTPSGMLRLARSQDYTATVANFSHTNATKFDLSDIAFVSAAEATFSGNTTGGTLSVTDGSHTARIHLAGNFTGSTFVASSDGRGGTIVVDPEVAAQVHRFIAAAADFGPAPAAPTALAEHSQHLASLGLAAPRGRMAWA